MVQDFRCLSILRILHRRVCHLLYYSQSLSVSPWRKRAEFLLNSRDLQLLTVKRPFIVPTPISLHTCPSFAFRATVTHHCNSETWNSVIIKNVSESSNFSSTEQLKIPLLNSESQRSKIVPTCKHVFAIDFLVSCT